MSEETDVMASLPFSPLKQDALLGHLLFNDRFFKQAKSKIQPSWFVDGLCQKIWKAKVDWSIQYERPPTIEELKECNIFLAEEHAIITKLRAKIGLCQLQMQNFPIDVLSIELTDWLHAKTYQDYIKKSLNEYNKANFQEAYAINKRMSKEIDETRFNEDREVDFDNPVGYLDDAIQQRKNALTFGLDCIDRLMLPEAESGSLLPGDTTIIVASTNTGKTTCVITVIAANVKRMKSVLLLTHEGRESDLREKILCALLGISRADLFKLYKTEEGIDRINRQIIWIKRFLKFVSYNKAGATVEEVEAIIRRKQEERIAKTGKPFDLLVDDYPAKLKTIMARGGNFSLRNIIDYAYDYFVQLGLEYGTHNVLPIQTNREGSKINKNVSDKEKRVVVGEDVQEAFGVIQTGTNVITINRDPVAKARNLLTYYIDKSRSNETGFSVVCKTDFGRVKTHGNELGAFWYRGTHVITDKPKVEEWVQRYNGLMLPDGMERLA